MGSIYSTMAKGMSQKMSNCPGKPGNMKTSRQEIKVGIRDQIKRQKTPGIRKQPITVADNEKLRRKKKDRKEQRKLGGLVIGGKLRGCEGIADIAFLEWLLLHRKLTQETLWNQYQEDFGDLPADMCPRSAHKPRNLYSQLNAVVKKVALFKENVAKARVRIDDIEAAESVLSFVKRTQKKRGSKTSKTATVEGEGKEDNQLVAVRIVRQAQQAIEAAEKSADPAAMSAAKDALKQQVRKLPADQQRAVAAEFKLRSQKKKENKHSGSGIAIKSNNPFALLGV